MHLKDKNDPGKAHYDYERFNDLLYQLRPQHKWLSGQNFYFLKTCSQIRNVLAHNNHNSPIKEFDEDFFRKLQSFNAKFFTPISKVAITKDDIKHLNWNTPLNEAIKELKTKNYSYLPILNDGYVEGVFSKSIVFDFLSEQEDCVLKSNLTLRHLEGHAHLDHHLNKTLAFVDNDMTLTQVFSIFSDYYHDGKKLVLVFITEHGKANQRILGMYTVWDFLKYN